jgi:hypothetical protein
MAPEVKFPYGRLRSLVLMAKVANAMEILDARGIEEDGPEGTRVTSDEAGLSQGA